MMGLKVIIPCIVTLFVFQSVIADDPFKYSGYIPINETQKSNMFYWFFEAMNANQSAPVILWLQGGPGCSLTMGLFSENGPYKLTDDLELVANPYAWNQEYHLLYLDNPIGTGFSYTFDPAGYATSEEQVGDDLYTALSYFFAKVFPQYASNDLYIFGESYAGKYIPTIAHVIHQQNPVSSLKINLKGVGIGDGWVDPLHQTAVYADFCYQTGLIDADQARQIKDMETEALVLIEKEEWVSANYLWNNITLQIMEWSGMVNPSDIRIYGFASFATFDVTTSYVNQSSIRQQLGVPDFVNFTMMSNVVPQYLLSDEMKSVAPYVLEMLDSAGIKVLLFNGNFDFTVPIIGTENWIRELDWSGRDGFAATQRNIWNVNNNTAGYVKQFENLSFVTVVQAGHMAAMDQPENVLDLVTRFIDNMPFD